MKRAHILPVIALALLPVGCWAQAQLSDAQIMTILETANQVDMDAGRMAQTRARSREVREFGRDMFRDHRGLNRQARSLARKLKLRLQGTEVSKSLEESGRENVANLRRLSGSDFDRAYMTREVAYHQQVLEALEKQLIPNARNDELKKLATSARGAVAEHLEHARRLQAGLGK